MISDERLKEIVENPGFGMYAGEAKDMAAELRKWRELGREIWGFMNQPNTEGDAFVVANIPRITRFELKKILNF